MEIFTKGIKKKTYCKITVKCGSLKKITALGLGGQWVEKQPESEK